MSAARVNLNLNDDELYVLALRGWTWVVSIDANFNECRSLAPVEHSQLTKVERADKALPVHQVHFPLPLEEVYAATRN